MKLIKFTKEGLESLRNELSNLMNIRPDAVKELSRAREMGDLSENGLYTAAKSRLRSIDANIRRISNQIKLAQVVPSQKFLVENDGKQIEYEVVGDFEADPHNNKISSNSPIGKALIGKSEGDQVQIETPSGTRILKILRMF